MNGLCSLVALALTLSGLIHCAPLKKSDVAAEKEEIKRGDYEGPCRRCPSCEVGPCEPCNPCEPKPEPEPEPCNTTTTTTTLDGLTIAMLLHKIVELTPMACHMLDNI